MTAYASHLRKAHDNEVLYGGSKPQPKPFTTDRDILDRHHKFLRDDDTADSAAEPLVKDYYESLIKDCVLVDLSRYKEKQVASLSNLIDVRWR
jgi:protein FRA10AC1